MFLVSDGNAYLHCIVHLPVFSVGFDITNTEIAERQSTTHLVNGFILSSVLIVAMVASEGLTWEAKVALY